MKKTLSLIALTGVVLACSFPALAQDTPQAAKGKVSPLVIAAILSLPPVAPAVGLPPAIPAAGHGAGQACTYQYYYDAAHTQPSGVCYGACYAGGNFCDGVVTDYSEIAWCERCACGPNGGNC